MRGHSQLSRLWLAIGGLSGAMAVGFGAYAAHGLADNPQATLWVEKACRYQMYHALALVLVSILQRDGGRLTALAGGLFVAGTLFFCGALYALALTSLSVAWVAPYGGSSFILGWLALVLAALRRRGGI
ncbi:MAG: DUF423 domain-containing protein [Telmatospirillum sp.]|nr:DUF423 domain-containing protein [Telmatospirillum sp.]